MIKIFPSRLEGEPLEVHQTHIGMTMREWLAGNAPDCDTNNPQFTMHINGALAGLDCEFYPDDVVEVWVEPRGVVAVIIVAVVALVVALTMRPKTPKQQEQRQGRPLESATLSGNVVRYGEPIPEIAGRPPRVYPNFLLPTRTYYSEPRVQWFEAFFCVGKGEYEKSVADVYIGDTRAPALGDDVQITFYEPGEDVSGETAADWWHTPQEVGFTNRGNAGMELGTVTGRSTSVNASAFTVVGDTVSIATGDDFPADWTAGVELQIEVPYPTTITAGARDLIESEHAFSHFAPTAGMQVTLGGDEGGTYLVHSYTPASGSTPAIPGTPSTYTASDAPARLDFGTTPAGLTVVAPVGTYTVYLSSNYSSDGDLLLAINAQLNNTAIVAALAGGRLQISERSAPFSGQMIAVSGSAHDDLFGSAPVGALGIKTEPAKPAGVASMTLSTLDGLPVNDLLKGQIQLAVTPAGKTYEVVQRVTPRVLTVTDANWETLTSADIVVSLGAASADVGWTGPFTVAPPDELVDAIEIDYIFPSGLIHHNKKGRAEAIPATVYVEWRELGSSSWNGEHYDHHLAEPDAMGFTRRIELGEPKAVEVRMRRSPKLAWMNTSEDIQWTALRGRMQGRPTSYAGVTTMAVKLRTGDRLSSQTEDKIWLRVTRILEGLDGQRGPTRAIAPFLLNMFKACGYGENRIDMVALAELDDIWQARQDNFDLAVDKHTTVKRLANDALRAGFAELTIDRGLLTPVRDARRESPNYIYSPQEFIDYPTVTTAMLEPDEIDGVDAEYVDGVSGKTETIKYRLLGEEGLRAEKIQLPGVTNWTRAWRLAARHRRVLAYRRTSFKGTTELHALNSSYMSYDRIQDGIPEYGQSAFVTWHEGRTLRLSERIDWGGDKNKAMAMRQLDGRVTRPVWIERGADDWTVVLLDDAPLDIHLGDSRDPTMVYVGSVRTWAHDVLVTSIAPSSGNTVDIGAVVYDDRVYMDDDRDPQNEVYLTSEVYEAERATSLVYEPDEVTSTLYAIEGDDELSKSGRLLGGILKEFIKEYTTEVDILAKRGQLLGGDLKALVHEYASDDELSKGGTLLGGNLIDVVKTYNADADKLDKSGQLIGGNLVEYVIVYEHRPENLNKAGVLLGGELYED